ncbi:MAG: dicarboxylate/amino acid:cation symporter [Solitalea-like symbiont of Tyrophagus putrescentiae]
MKKIGLIQRLIIAIILGIIIGLLKFEILTRILVTFNGIFNNFLSFAIPLIILGFVASGITALGKNLGKILFVAVLLAYLSTIIAGLIAYFTNGSILPILLKSQHLSIASQVNPEESLLVPYFKIDMPPVMQVMTALLLSFIIGMGAVIARAKFLKGIIDDFQIIVDKLVAKVLVPLLPIHICGIIANMTHVGQIWHLLQVFIKVFIVIILLHILYLLIQYTIVGIVTKRNPLRLLKTMLPAYVTALGTQSSAATIPVTLSRAKVNGISEGIRNFAIPLFANIHLAGSAITITSCAIAIAYLTGMQLNISVFLPFIMMLGITMVAAPGVPGGAIMSALGLLQTMLGFNDTAISLMIALYITQDSFGTACNVTGDAAIAMLVDNIHEKNPSVARNEAFKQA